MNEKIDTAIDKLLEKIRTNSKSDEDLRYSQAALNLAHVKQVLGHKTTTKGAGS